MHAVQFSSVQFSCMLCLSPAPLSLTLTLDLLTRSDSVPCPMAVPCGHACPACGSALRQSGGEIISTAELSVISV